MEIPERVSGIGQTRGALTMNHILVVEDEDHLAQGIRFNLEAEGYRVSVAPEGAAALHIFEQADPPVDLVILDLMLPGMSGYDVCLQLRQRGSDVPVLMLSARTLAEDRTRGFDTGADQYLTKPFDLEELLSRVKRLLERHHRRERRGPNQPEHFRFGQVDVNFHSFSVKVNGKSVPITPLELKLLRYFAENEGRVISRSELLENVWDVPGNLRTRAVDQFVRRLRKLCEPDPSTPRHFLTLRDAGYRFVAQPE